MRHLTETTCRQSREMTSVLAFLLIGITLAWGTASPTVAQEQSAAFDYDDIGLRVALWLDKEEGEIYRKGSNIEVGFQTNEDAYAVVYRVDTEGLVTVLWPRSRLDDGFVFGGHEYLLPVTSNRSLQVSNSEGEGFVEAVVSRYPFDLRRLELDFHHENKEESYGFRVAGDPFLALNEVNFAITGLEDSGDYVVTNYVSYYVHAEVDHPRYLCSQCHFEDDTAYDPYRDDCTLEITVDHRWSNSWWNTYGYYPAYYNPVYVYVDPWTWRPWINFWYDPFWRTPNIDVCYWDSPVGVWVDHHYYPGDVTTCWNGGHDRYRPLNPVLSDSPRTKTREYGNVTPMVRERSGGGDRPRGKTVRTPREQGQPPYKGEGPIRRDQPRYEPKERQRTNPGLVLRGGRDNARPSDSGRADVRHVAGDRTRSPRTAPIVRTAGDRRITPTSGGGPGVPATRPGEQRIQRPGSGKGGIIRTVEPRQKETRIWNSERLKKTGSRSQRPERVRPSDSGKRQRTPTRYDGSNTRGGTTAGRKQTSGTAVRKSGQQRNTKSSGTRSGSQGTRSQPTRSNKSGATSSGRSGGSSGRSKSGGGKRGGRVPGH